MNPPIDTACFQLGVPPDYDDAGEATAPPRVAGSHPRFWVAGTSPAMTAESVGVCALRGASGRSR